MEGKGLVDHVAWAARLVPDFLVGAGSDGTVRSRCASAWWVVFGILAITSSHFLWFSPAIFTPNTQTKTKFSLSGLILY
jgi:hypothetical protein